MTGVGKPCELSVKINVDIADALTGLKAIQREAKKAAQALRELEAVPQNGRLAVLHSGDYVILREEADQFAKAVRNTPATVIVSDAKVDFIDPAEAEELGAKFAEAIAKEVRD